MVILGAGFGGLAAARALKSGSVEVTLIDRNIYSTFQPLLYQVATGGLNPGDISYPIRSFTRRNQIHFRRADVARIDVESSSVVFSDGDSLPYDYLVLATGARVNYFGVPGAEIYGHSLYRRPDALSLRDNLFGLLENAASGHRTVSLVIIGGGPTGVEMAGTLAERRDAGLAAAFPEIDPADVSVTLVEQGSDLIAPFDRRLRDYTRRELERRRVRVLTDTKVTHISEHEVLLDGGRTLPSDLTVWSAGVGVNDWGLSRGRGGRVVVDGFLRVIGQQRIFAVGDVAADERAPLPQLAQPAIQMGKHVGKEIRSLLEGRPLVEFRYRDKGTMATIGRRSAVVQLPLHVLATGTPAWLAWLALHVFSLLGNRNRLSALLNLAWRYLNWPTGSGVIVGDIPEESK